ncbi:MAG: PepSY domain-containing protein [Emcibacter sp.]|nr:PepSY domain-containing protein [Emcibacter sp.]
MNIKLKSITALLIANSLSLTVYASDNKCDAGPKSDWMTKEAITQSLTANGYTVRKIEEEDGCYEAYALKDGKKIEIYINPKTGDFVKTKEK